MHRQEVQRKIIHVDMDAFYASVEQLDDPTLRGKPIAVGGSKERGVVAAASYEARAFGVHSAMPSKIAYSRCPGLIFVRPRFERYRQLSKQIRSIFFGYTDLVEPLSLDEAFLDVTENKQSIQRATEIAQRIRKEIFAFTGLTASAGISKNKFLAKIASDVNKPNGQFLIHPLKAEAYVEMLPIKKFFGIGTKTAQKMARFGIQTGKDLKEQSLEFLVREFGKAGQYYYWISRSIDNRPVQASRVRKSVGAETTFDRNLSEREELIQQLEALAAEVSHRLNRARASGNSITLKVKFSDFTVITRSTTLEQPAAKEEAILNAVVQLLNQHYSNQWTVRLLGISVKQLKFENSDAPKQLTLDF